MFAQIRVWFLALLMVWALSHASVLGGSGEPPARELSLAEKTRRILDQPMNLDYTGRTLQDVVQHLREKIHVNIVLDTNALQQVGLIAEENASALPPTVTIRSERPGKIRSAIQRMLNAFNLTYVILDDTVLITTEESGLNRQLRQRVSVSLTNVPFSAVLKDLARNTALNLIIDPRIGREADAKVSLQLDDAALETAVRLLAEMANLKSVRLGNVLFITNESRAEKLRREEPPPVVVPGFVPNASLREGG